MRYLSSISLAVVLLMALACTAAPAAPTPNIDATVQVNNVPPNPDLAMDYYFRASGYLRSGDDQLAIEDYTKAIELGLPTTHHDGSTPLATAYGGRAIAYDYLGQYQRALEDYDRVIQLEPDLAAVAYSGRGLIYDSMGQHQLAIFAHDKAIELEPGNALFYHNRSLAYFNLGQYAETDADQATACSLDSQYC